jgi:hypothetical protein
LFDAPYSTARRRRSSATATALKRPPGRTSLRTSSAGKPASTGSTACQETGHPRALTPSANAASAPRAQCGLAASADPACGWRGSLPTALPPPASDHAVLSAVISPSLHPLRLTRAGADRGRDNFESIKVGGRKSGGAAAAASVEGCEGKCLKGCETSCPRQHSDASTRSKCVDDCGFECHELCRPQVGAGSARSHRTSSLRAWPMSLSDLTPSSSIGKPIFVFNWTYPLITLSHSHGVSNLGETTRSAR